MAIIKQTFFKIEVSSVELYTIITALQAHANALTSDGLAHCSDEQGLYNEEEADRMKTLAGELAQVFK